MTMTAISHTLHTRLARWLTPIAILIAVTGCRQPEYEEEEPPLRSLVYTESPGYDEDKAVLVEEHLLKVYRETGRIPSATESAEMLREALARQNDAKPGDAVLDSLMPEFDDDPDTIDPMIAPPPDDGGPIHLRSPEALAEAAFKALITQDKQLYDKVFISAEGLVALARINDKTARKRAGALRRKAASAFKDFSPGNASEAPADGLNSKMLLKEIRVGKAGTIWGKAPTDGEEVVQHWGNLLVFRLMKSRELEEQVGETLFTVSLGRMLKTPDGEWRLAAPPEVSSLFKVYLNAGLHLKAELMAPEHHPFPLSVGNFWRYTIARASKANQEAAPPPVNDDDEEATEERSEPTTEEVRIEVVEVEKFDGYRMVTLRRQQKNTRTRTDTLRYLVTPRRLYHCSSFCRYKIKDMNFILGYVRKQTPLLIFPLNKGISWKSGGVRVTRGARYHIREKDELAVVPAGEFSNTLVIGGRSGSSYTTRYFKPGVGIVQRVKRSNSDTRVEELVEYRILTTE